MRIIRVWFEIEAKDFDGSVSLEVDVPEGFEPFAVDGPHLSGNQVRDIEGPHKFSVWCRAMPQNPYW